MFQLYKRWNIYGISMGHLWVIYGISPGLIGVSCTEKALQLLYMYGFDLTGWGYNYGFGKGDKDLLEVLVNPGNRSQLALFKYFSR